MDKHLSTEDFEFISKLYTKSKITFPFYRKLTYALIATYTILVALTFFKDGFSLGYLFKHIITYLLCYVAILNTNPQNGYQIAIARIFFDDNKFTVKYGNQKDEAAYIPSTANVSIYYDNIIEFKYDNLLQELFIREINEKSKDESFTIIYIPEEESDFLMNHILEKCSYNKDVSIIEPKGSSFEKAMSI